MHIHIGSPVYTIQPYVDAVTKMIALIERLTERGHKIEWFVRRRETYEDLVALERI